MPSRATNNISTAVACNVTYAALNELSGQWMMSQDKTVVTQGNTVTGYLTM